MLLDTAESPGSRHTVVLLGCVESRFLRRVGFVDTANTHRNKGWGLKLLLKRTGSPGSRRIAVDSGARKVTLPDMVMDQCRSKTPHLLRAFSELLICMLH